MLSSLPRRLEVLSACKTRMRKTCSTRQADSLRRMLTEDAQAYLLPAILEVQSMAFDSRSAFAGMARQADSATLKQLGDDPGHLVSLRVHDIRWLAGAASPTEASGAPAREAHVAEVTIEMRAEFPQLEGSFVFVAPARKFLLANVILEYDPAYGYRVAALY